MSVQIGLPVLGDLPDEIFYSILSLKRPPGSKLTKISGMPADIARNEIIKRMENDWIFFMDSDQTFHPDTLLRLLSWDLPIISGVYFKSPGKPIPHCYEYAGLNEKGIPFYKSLVEPIFNYLDKFGQAIVEESSDTFLFPTQKEQLIECDGVGAGCLLVNRKVIETIKPPHFKYTDDSTGGEDFYFCRKAQEAGFKIFIDPGVICGHRMKGLIGARHFLSWATEDTNRAYPYPWE